MNYQWEHVTGIGVLVLNTDELQVNDTVEKTLAVPFAMSVNV